METANLYIGVHMVFANATFQRIPEVGEWVSYLGVWHKVTVVGHSWVGTSTTPQVNISIEDHHADAAAAHGFTAEAGPA